MLKDEIGLLSNKEILLTKYGAENITECVRWKRRMPKGILTDEEIVLTVCGSQKGYPEYMRLVRFYDEEKGREFMFLTPT